MPEQPEYIEELSKGLVNELFFKAIFFAALFLLVFLWVHVNKKDTEAKAWLMKWQNLGITAVFGLCVVVLLAHGRAKFNQVNWAITSAIKNSNQQLRNELQNERNLVKDALFEQLQEELNNNRQLIEGVISLVATNQLQTEHYYSSMLDLEAQRRVEERIRISRERLSIITRHSFHGQLSETESTVVVLVTLVNSSIHPLGIQGWSLKAELEEGEPIVGEMILPPGDGITLFGALGGVRAARQEDYLPLSLKSPISPRNVVTGYVGFKFPGVSQRELERLTKTFVISVEDSTYQRAVANFPNRSIRQPF